MIFPANPFEQGNFRPISILSNIAKVFKKIMHNQMNGLFIDKLSYYQCVFRKRFGTQRCLLLMIKNFGKSETMKGFLLLLISQKLSIYFMWAANCDFNCIRIWHEYIWLNLILAYFNYRKQELLNISYSFSDFHSIFLVFHKVQYLDLFFLSFTYVICL